MCNEVTNITEKENTNTKWILEKGIWKKQSCTILASKNLYPEFNQPRGGALRSACENSNRPKQRDQRNEKEGQEDMHGNLDNNSSSSSSSSYSSSSSSSSDSSKTILKKDCIINKNTILAHYIKKESLM